MRTVLTRRESRLWLPFMSAVVTLLFIVGWALVSPGTLELSSAPAQWPLPTLWPIPERFASPETGVNVHMWWDPWAAIRRG